ncbi:hypothetical protein GCM10017786_13960 [Amycolatopsis deserti]|uniref:Blue (type 1) copper domain-containing protein n=1 Tax=Amycolatopsis deserti TaxID=185696 RepID=A0ABQ3IKA4_9PSEU|nr:cupredoxin family copper-binding protein [Amycolatopsis deserti]GHE83898.1 hypothetical protein GCM10017786_13960 [Amycolatopsis deserti]
MRVLLVAVLALASCLFAAPPAGAASQAVMMEGYAYSPSSLTVRVGDTVTWTNHDQAPHDVVTTSAPVAFKSAMLSQGQSWSYTFTTPGTYSYYCSVHPDMRATIVVQPAPVAAAPASTAPRTSTPKATRSPSAAAPAAPAPSMSMPPAAESTTEATTAPDPAVANPAVAAPVTPASTTTTLDPKLVVAGVAAGIAVLCLLLLVSRRET